MIWLTTMVQKSSPVQGQQEAKAFLVNEKTISYVWPQTKGSMLIFIGDWEGLHVSETPAEIHEIIGAVL